VGRGIIHADKSQAWVDGQFFLDTAGGQETYKTVKNLGELQEWSYGYEILDRIPGQFEGQDVQFLRKLKVHEVSPVMLGVGEDTHTVAIKARADVKAAFASHDSETSEGAWDGPANEKNVRTDEADSYYKRIYAWKDPDGEAGKKETYSFIHHEVDSEGEPGAANMKACASAIGILNGGRGVDVAAQPWGKDRAGIHKHLAAHMMDADMEAPELMPMSEMMGKEEKAFTDEEVRQLKAFLQMVGDSMDVKAGRRNSNADEDRMKRISELMEEMSSLMRELIGDEGKDEGGDEGDDARQQEKNKKKREPLAQQIADELLKAGVFLGEKIW
jgi:hypothetical protein